MPSANHFSGGAISIARQFMYMRIVRVNQASAASGKWTACVRPTPQIKSK